MATFPSHLFCAEVVVPEVNLPLSRENLSQLANEVDHLQESDNYRINVNVHARSFLQRLLS